MIKTNKERVLDYLWSMAPDYVTNSQIREWTGISSHQQVHMLTRELMWAGRIRGEQHGREWVFWADESLGVQLASPGRVPMREVFALAEKELSPRAFEDLARRQRLPPAKFSVIAEHVWLLGKTGASIAFLVFGNDRQVPVLWLERYGQLVSGAVTFYFLADDGELEQLSVETDH